ncbi:MAG: bifunctional folylpolyglutamate synthase/dihydrofolate synthase [Limnochordia bacterium]|nr:bifunctional folylpolyglutamate synthase/dihydrofolate synthase [Limnochordia bacterium]
MGYIEAVEYLESLARFGSKPGLSRIRQLAQSLGDPQERFPAIHIAGTNGKGSTARMTAAILSAHGLKTGLYTSPHIGVFNERFMIDGEPISDQGLSALVDKLQPITQQGLEQPTEFEVCTALALEYFAQEAVDCAVIEVGLGGRFDATNIIVPEVAVITHIALDHMGVLGTTLEQIAFEKAGIIKTGKPLVLTPQSSAARGVILDIAKAQHSAVYELDPASWHVQEVSLDGTVFTYEDQRIHLNLLGRHQIINACAAITGARVFLQDRFCWRLVHKSLGEVSWPGRLEIMGTNPLILLDGAHNLDGAEVLKQAICDLLPTRRIVFLMSIMEDKEVDAILRTLLPRGKVAVFTQPKQSRTRPTSPHELRQRASAYLDEVYAELDPGVALEQALRLIDVNDVLCISGSLYLVRELRQLLCRNYHVG